MLRSCSLLAALLHAACAADEDTSRSALLDPEVAPVTEGSWYRPALSTTWQWQLVGTINQGYAVEVYDIDLFDTPAATIAELKGAGRRVICYFSAGSSEDWRDDFGAFDEAVMGEPLDDWEGERWLDIRKDNVLEIMRARLDLAASKGCDGVEPDNVDGFANETGFSLSRDDQRAFNKYLANEAHRRGLTVGLKNCGGLAAELVTYFDFSLNEQCHEYDECAELSPFTSAAKPIFNAEYTGSLASATTLAATLCPAALAESIRTLILPLDLDDSFRVSCD
jgi:hypothetical protein